jgi:hypothetical protein
MGCDSARNSVEAVLSQALDFKLGHSRIFPSASLYLPLLPLIQGGVVYKSPPGGCF